MDEKSKRLFVAAEARAAGRGGPSAVARATRVARSTIYRGLNDLDDRPGLVGEIRRKGGGAKPLADKDATLVADLLKLLEPATMGDPMRPLRWTSKSPAKLAFALRGMRHKISESTVRRMLVGIGFRRQFNRKTLEGASHVDRNAQFQHISDTAAAFLAAGDPVISVDTKKKELVGQFKNGGSDYLPAGQPVAVNVHDFMDKDLGKVAPYGIYDVYGNVGFVNVGINHDTSEFAVNAIRRWHAVMGAGRYPEARRLMITADGGGSNGSRVRLWKVELQKLADELGIEIVVCHYPPGTSSRVDDWRGGFSLPVG